MADFLGNQAVDELCRAKATEMLPQAWKVNAYLAEGAATSACIKFVAKMLVEYDDIQNEMLSQAKQATKELAGRRPLRVRPLPRPHDWQWDRVSKRWLCQLCGTRVARRTGNLGQRGCPGHWTRLHEWCQQAEANGHTTHISSKATGEPGKVITCTDCGLYAECFPRKLKEPCQGFRTTYKATRIRQGRHPKQADWLHHHRRWQPHLTRPPLPPQLGVDRGQQAGGAEQPKGATGLNHVQQPAVDEPMDTEQEPGGTMHEEFFHECYECTDPTGVFAEDDDPLQLGFGLDED